MSESVKGQLATLLSGRWQVPVALVAALAAAGALYRLLPKQTPVEIGTLLADIAALEQAGAPADAADAIANLLAMEPPLAPAQQAVLHDRLATLIYLQERQRRTPIEANDKLILEHHDAAMKLGAVETPETALREAEAADWLGNSPRAIDAYRRVLEEGATPPQCRTARKGLVRLLAEVPSARSERQRYLEELLDDSGTSEGYLWWALQQSLADALDENDTVRARLLLAKHGQRLGSTSLRGYLEYLWAWVMLREGRPEEAEPVARWVDDWLGQRGGDNPALRDFGRLPLMNRWLMGRIHLAEYRPQDALEAFDDALALHPENELFVAAAAGRGEALAALERHDAALRSFDETVDKLQSLPPGRRYGVEQMLGTFTTLEQRFAQESDYPHALGYLKLAAGLVGPDQPKRRAELFDRLADLSQRAALASTTDAEQRRYRGQAAHFLEEVALLNRDDEERYSSQLWAAAQEYDRAGLVHDARRVLDSFLDGRSRDPRLPAAMLIRGQVLQAEGAVNEALRQYEELMSDYPKLEQAYRAAHLRAGLLRAAGHYEDAESALQALLADDNLAPDAQVFRDALLDLCELLYDEERFADAIGRLEDFATLYPNDPERHRSAFMLADAYRRSGLELKRSAGVDEPQVRETAANRLRRAAELFDNLSRELTAQESLDDAEVVYDRLALLYQADCLFALNDPASLEAALNLYQQAAARFEREPTALTAQLQIATIHLRQGRPTEAARAIERARWLLAGIPDAAFAQNDGAGGRAHWERYLRTVGSSDLIEQALAGAP